MIRRIAAALLILVVGGTLLLAVWPQLFGLQLTPLVAHLVSFRALAACVAAALVLIFVIASMVNRGFRRMAASLCVMLLVFILVNAAVLSTRGFGGNELKKAAADESANELTVLAWNTLGPATQPETIAKLALAHEADIVVLPETIAANAEQVAVLMRAGGHPMWVHTLAYDQVSPALSTSLLTSVGLGEYDFDRDTRTTTVVPTLVGTPTKGGGPTIVAVHAVAPIPGQFENWPKDLRLLAELCSGENVIMAGDFNATIDHMAGLGTEAGRTLGQCTDAAASSKSAALGTWPTMLPALLGSPIDHVMATPNWTVAGTQVIQSLDGNGSDHRPIVVRLVRAG